MRLAGNRELPGGARLVQVTTDLATRARPGHWFRLDFGSYTIVSPALDASAKERWIAFQVPADKTEPLRHIGYGSPCTVHGPLGTPIPPPEGNRRRLLLADETGLAAALFCSTSGVAASLVLVELSAPVPPVRLCPSRFLVTGLAAGAIAGLVPLEAAGTPSRASHPQGLPGCAEDSLDSMLDAWLEHCSARQRWETCAITVGGRDFVERIDGRLRGRVGRHRGYPPPTSMA